MNEEVQVHIVEVINEDTTTRDRRGAAEGGVIGEEEERV
jgi:hypothetical protein